MFARILDITGFVLAAAGAAVVYIYSPSYSMDIDGGTFDGTPTETELENMKKERRMKVGFFVMLSGFALQLAGRFIP